jgi:hypothetical protein
MGNLVLAGATSGSITLEPTAVAGTSTLTLPALTGTVLTSASPQSAFPSNIAGTGPAFSAWQSVQQTGVSATTWTKVTLTTELFDTNSNYASSRFTPTVAGYYQISGSVTMVSTTNTHYIGCAIYKNGTNYAQATFNLANANYYAQSTISTLVYFNGSTDYVELYSYGTAGGSYNIYNVLENTNFSGVLVRAA